MNKKFYEIGFYFLLIMLSPFRMLTAQTNVPYWVETFSGTACTLTTTVPTANISYYFQGNNSGTWWGKNVFNATGSACANNGAAHVRFRNVNLGDSGELVTPVVNLGIKELHFTRTRANRTYRIYTTTDTSAITSNWSFVVNIPSSPNICSDTSILINSATARRLKIKTATNADSDIDSLWLTNYSSNAFTAGRLAVLKVGDGITTLSNQSNMVSIEEYTFNGASGYSMALPTVGANRFVVQGSSANDAQMNLSSDLQKMVFGGYDTSFLVTQVSATNCKRVIGGVGANGIFNILVSSSTYNPGNFRSVTSDGTNYWAVGSGTLGLASGLGTNGSGLSNIVSNNPTANMRSVAIQNGQLFFSSEQTTIKGIYRVGNGKPTVGPITASLYIATGSSSSPNGFAINADSSICYVADDGTNVGIHKFVRSGSTWSKIDSATTSMGSCRNLVVDWSGSNPIIYVVSGINKLVKIVDVGSNLNGQSIVTLATASSNTAFRGLCFTPGTDLKVNAPKVSTAKVASIGINNATIGGAVIDTGSSAVSQRGVVYGTSINPTLTNTKVVIGNGMGSFSQSVSGLSPLTLYHVRAFAINNSDTVYGGDSTFTTLAQPAPYVTLNLFLEAMYSGTNTMAAAPFNADAVSPSSIADTITVNLHQSIAPYNLAYSVRTTLNSSGVANLSFPNSTYGNSYYLVVKHRNSIETWSASPVLMNDSITYSFTSSASQAFGANIASVGNGKFAIFSGDINQDGSVDFNDYPDLDIRSSNGDLGYLSEDLNGDASVDFNDYPVIDINSSNGIISLRP